MSQVDVKNVRKFEDCEQLLVQMRSFQENFGDYVSIDILRHTYFLTDPDDVSPVTQDPKHFQKYP